MYTLPKTTYSFSQSCREDGKGEDVTIEFDTNEPYLDDILEKFERFLRASGFYLDGMTIEAVKIDEDDHSHCNHDEETISIPEPPRWAMDQLYPEMSVSYNIQSDEQSIKLNEK